MDGHGTISPLTARRHPLALLALLATAPGCSLSRGRIVGLLWPDAIEQAARNRLTSCVYDVRSALGAAVLRSRGADLRLDTTLVTTDVAAFEAALSGGEAEAAVRAYGGPLLDGFALGGSAEFEQRMDIERDRLHWLYREALERVAQAAAAGGDADRAVHWWRVRAADDPFDSRVAAELVAALGSAGNRAEALRVGEHHIRLLDEELGAPPDPAVVSALADLRRGSTEVTADTARHGSVPPSSHPDLADLSPRRVAVLPFRSLGSSEEATIFAEGLHEDLLTELSRFAALSVIARTSVDRYRASDVDAQQVARELGAGTVVHGAVRTAGDRLRLTVQLVDARTNEHRWVERFDRELHSADIFDVQGELAARISSTLRMQLTRAELDAAHEPTRDLEAFALYTRGKVLLDQRTPHDMTRSAEYFQRAIDRDPGYALAWSGLAEALAILHFYRCPPLHGAPEPVDAALRAVEKAPLLGQAHAALGITYSSVGRRGPEAMLALQRAVELAPGYAPAQAWLGWLHLLRGTAAEGLHAARRAVELDPLAPAYHVYYSETLLALGALDEALQSAEHARSLRPEYAMAHFMAALVLHHSGRAADAAAAYHIALEFTGPEATPTREEILAALAVSLVRLEDHDAARDLLRQLPAGGHAFSVGLVHAALGETEEAFAAWERVTAWDSFSVDHARYFFPDVIGPLRPDPRFRVLMQRIRRTWGGN